VCEDQGWATKDMWKKLNAGATWYVFYYYIDVVLLESSFLISLFEYRACYGTVSCCCVYRHKRDLWFYRYKAKNEAYMYWNQSDKHWWIDEPGGNGTSLTL
jgi:hypothetical protein